MTSSFTPVFIILGIFFIVFSLGRAIRRKSTDSLDKLKSLREKSESVDFDRRHQAVADRQVLISEMEKHLDNRIQTLKILIQEADQRIQRLYGEKGINNIFPNGNESESSGNGTGNSHGGEKKEG